MDTTPYSDRASRPAVAPPTATTDEDSLFINPRRKYKRRGTGSISDTKSEGSEDEAGSSMSESEEHELGLLDSDVDADDDDGESGLNQHERRKYIKRKRRRDGLDARIAGTTGLSKDEAREADKNVVRNLVINAVLIGLWYFFSLSISIYNKMMFSSDHLDFHFPLFATSLHMVVQFILASCILLIFPSLRPSQPHPPGYGNESHSSKPLVTPLFYFTRLVPTGTTTSLDIGLGNTSLRFITLTFYTMCKSSVLIFVLVFAFLFRLEKPSLKLILIILTMTLGVLMMVAGETAFHALGFALAISASFFSGFRWALTQILLLRHPATSNPFATMFFIAPIMFVTLFFIACVSETPSAVVTGIVLLVREHGVVKALLLLVVPGCIAFCMIASEFTLLQRTSVVTLSICGIFKEVVTISAAGIVFHDELSMVNISGLIITIISIASYNYLKIVKMREEARERLKKKDEQQYRELGDEDDDEISNAAAADSALLRDGTTVVRDPTTSSSSAPRSDSIQNGALGPSAKKKENTE
ncbi:uncharacterized protein A1O5_06457 [Cladophialophora psammophila CBS 110553]|uniref:Sugar phosphate transporter domain-containing protein n=1 Tax=Cladophialophora psammophila CBS 110553 TaxID=1182543 RepID=W9XJ59_9EURO|nr:uncharacterized protein A1O5_06457 [Cladophialophora psammophila CBS 110553]EXJ70389.1 hypothetical protein A1O5_06457 [Cladophialophora psammophila CBS 110553]